MSHHNTANVKGVVGRQYIYIEASLKQIEKNRHVTIPVVHLQSWLFVLLLLLLMAITETKGSTLETSSVALAETPASYAVL